MYFYQKKIQNSRFGYQGDFQYRSWNLGTDTEQLLLRSGITYRPVAGDVLFTLGYAFVGTGAIGGANALAPEHRIYQEVLFSQHLLVRAFLTHRFRFEQREIQNQPFRTRFRYNLFINVPLNKPTIKKGALYVAFYNELFLNGQQAVVNNQPVQVFDRNRTYIGLGYSLSSTSRIQLGAMRQITSNLVKWQWQASLHQNL